MRNQADDDQLSDLRQQTRAVLREAIGDVKDVAILDAPNQRNVGDSLIWEGEMAYLAQLGYRVRHVSDMFGYSAAEVRRDLPPEGVVLLHGGGNFGDLWVGHQRLREQIVTELTEYAIVQLPQSIYFQNAARAAQADRILAEHSNFILLIRDSLSHERAAEQLPHLRTIFCPDMALGFDPVIDPVQPDRNEIVVIARADHESASGLSAVEADWLAPYRVFVTDWWKDDSPPPAWRLARLVTRGYSFVVRVRRRMRKTVPPWVPLPRIPQTWERWALVTLNRLNVKYATTLYASAPGVVADRLHAHVLAALMGIDHVMLDNSYRKLGGVYDDYTHRFSTAQYSLDLEDARTRVRSALAA